MQRVIDDVDSQVPGKSWCDQTRKPLGALLLASLAAAALGFGLLSAPAASAASAYSGAEIVARAASQAGLPYCWAGGNQSGPTHGDGNVEGASHCGSGVVGFDCTGLTMFATGLALAHDSAQATNAVSNFGGQRIYHESELQPGDLVYFGGSFEAFDHVGVYAGGGMMWDADISYWIYPDGVHERTLSSVEHALPFVGGVRLWHEGGGGAPPEGSFVSYQGNVYRIAGGAPIYINSWAPFGGPQPTVALSASQWAALRQMPSNGTTIRGAETGQIYKVAGGAPLYLSSCDAGCGSAVNVSQYAIEHNGTPPGGSWHLNTVPANGTTLATPSSETGRIYKVAGGAPLWLNSCDADCGSPVEVNQYTIDANGAPPGGVQHLNTVPADGTTLRSAETEGIYKVAGGAPLYLASCDAGCGSPVEVNQYTIDANGAPPGGVQHLNTVPADGTTLATPSSETGRIYKVAGGAPLYLNSCDAECGSPVEVNQYTIDGNGGPPGGVQHLLTVPANGVFLRGVDAGRIYRVAGGAPIYITDCVAIGFPGCDMPFISVMQYTIDNLGAPAGGVAHLNAAPADGTVVEGLPSATYWLFNSGLRSPSLAVGAAVAVNDLSLASYPERPSPAIVPTSSGHIPTPQSHVDATRSTHPAAHRTAKQRLAKALAGCRRIKNRRKRTRCQAAARRRYHVKRKKR